MSSIFLVAAFCVPVHGQKSRKKLEEEKRRNIAKLEKTAKILRETESQKKANLGQLNALKQKEKIQKSLIRTMGKEIKLIDSEIEENEFLIGAMESDLDTLKKEYARMIYEASKANNTYNKLMFLFTSSNFYDLQMRLNYLGQYNKARKDQVEQITKVSETLKDQNKVLANQKEEKQSLLESRKIEQRNLVALETKKETVIQKLSDQEKKLKNEQQKINKSIAALSERIQKIIEQEIINTTPDDPKKIKLTKEEALLAKSFEGNKGHHIWPVKYGFVANKFGEHWHPTVAGVKIINIGIDVQTKKGSEVRCIYDGKVVAVANVPGMNKMVMVQHGDFFTVYTKVNNVFVASGQELKRKDPVGVAVTNSDGVTEMQFQIWKNSDKLDPEKWLSPL